MAVSNQVDPDALAAWTTRTRGEIPPALVGASLTHYKPSSGPSQVCLFGGRLVDGRGMRDDLFVLTGRTWTRVERGEGDDAPSPRYFHTAQIWRDNLVIHGGMGVISDAEGGFTDELEVTNNTYLFNLTARTWRAVASSGQTFEPTARYAHVSTIAGDKLVVVGGQDKDVEYIQELEVLDLEQETWVEKETMADVYEQRGSYRTTCCASAEGNVLLYSNFSFTDVRRVYEVLERRQVGPLSFHLHNASADMLLAETASAPAPQGLRFPSGGVIGDWLVWGGTYIASTMQEYCVWALNLKTLQWTALDLGQAQTLKSGSWNRGLLDAAANQFKIFGSLDSDLLEDYQKRATNFTHFVTLDLEAFGVYRAPPPKLGPLAQKLALQSFNAGLGNDFEIICEDGRRVACSRSVLEQRWPWLAAQRKEFSDLARARSFEPSAGGQDAVDGSGGGKLPAALLRNAQLHFPTEFFPVVVALVQYFYTLDLITPVQLAPPVLSSLLVLSKQYDIPDLERRVVHQMHKQLAPQTADSIISVAGISGAKSLMARALRVKQAAATGAKEQAEELSSRPPSSHGGMDWPPPPNGDGRGGDEGTQDGGGHRMLKTQSSQADNRPRVDSASLDRQNSYQRDFVFPMPPISPTHAGTPVGRRLSGKQRDDNPSRSHHSSSSSSSFPSDINTPRASAPALNRAHPRQRTISEDTSSAGPVLPAHLLGNPTSRARASSLSSSSMRSQPPVSSPLSLPSPSLPGNATSQPMDRLAISRSSQGSATTEYALPETPSDTGSPHTRSVLGFNGGKGQVRHRSNLSISSSLSGEEADIIGSSRSGALNRAIIPEVPSPHSASALEDQRRLAISGQTLEQNSLASVDLFDYNRHLSLSLNAAFEKEKQAQTTADDTASVAPSEASLSSGLPAPQRLGTSDIMALASSRTRSKSHGPTTTMTTTAAHLQMPPPSAMPPPRVSPTASGSTLYPAARTKSFAGRQDKSKVYQFGRHASGTKMSSPATSSQSSADNSSSTLHIPSPSTPSAAAASTHSPAHPAGSEGMVAMYGRGGAGRTVQPKTPLQTQSRGDKVKAKPQQGKEGKTFLGLSLKR